MNQQPQFGVIFDMDGVLVDSYESHFRAYNIIKNRGECGLWS